MPGSNINSYNPSLHGGYEPQGASSTSASETKSTAPTANDSSAGSASSTSSTYTPSNWKDPSYADHSDYDEQEGIYWSNGIAYDKKQENLAMT